MKNFPVSQHVEMIGGDAGMDKLQWDKFGLVLVTHSLPMQILCVLYKSRGLNIDAYLPLLAGKAVPALGERAKKRSRVKEKLHEDQ